MTAVQAVPAVPAQRSRATAMVLLGVALGLVIADIVAGVIAGQVAQYPVPTVTFDLAMVGMVVAGLVLVRDGLHAGLGVLLFGTAASGALYDLTRTLQQDVAPLTFLQPFVYWGYAALLSHLLVRWPDRRVESRGVRALLFGMYAVLPVLTVVWQLTWERRWFGPGTGSWWWWTVLPARDFSATVWQVQQVLFIALIASLIVVVAVRVVRARGTRRVALAPVAVVGIALAMSVVAEVVGQLGVAVPIDTNIVQNITLLAIPISVLVAATRRAPDGAAVPGRRLPPGDPVRLHYRLGLAAIATGLVMLVSVIVVLASGTGGANGPVPLPAPGPALVAQ